MKPGDRVIWIYSPKRSLLKGWRVQRIPGEIVRIHRQKIRIRVWMWGRLRLVNVYRENVLYDTEELDGIWMTGSLIPDSEAPQGATRK